MAWVNIPDTATDPDAPLTSALAKAWTGNFKGMADGDPGAPRVQGEAVQLAFIPDGSNVVTGMEGIRGFIAFGDFATTSTTSSGGTTATPSSATMDTSTNGGVSWINGSPILIARVGGISSEETIAGVWSRYFTISSNVDAVRFRPTNCSLSAIVAVDSFP